MEIFSVKNYLVDVLRHSAFAAMTKNTTFPAKKKRLSSLKPLDAIIPKIDGLIKYNLRTIK